MLSASEPGRSASPESPTEGEGPKRQASGHHPVSDVYQLGIHPSCSNQLIHDGRREILFKPTKQKDPLLSRGFPWSGRRDSNPRPSPWQGDALPAELRPRQPGTIPDGHPFSVYGSPWG